MDTPVMSTQQKSQNHPVRQDPESWALHRKVSS